MDKEKLLEWMVQIERLALCAFPTDLERTKAVHSDVVYARGVFAATASDASQERAKVVQEIVKALAEEAKQQTLTPFTCQPEGSAEAFMMAASWVSGRFG